MLCVAAISTAPKTHVYRDYAFELSEIDDPRDCIAQALVLASRCTSLFADGHTAS